MTREYLPSLRLVGVIIIATLIAGMMYFRPDQLIDSPRAHLAPFLWGTKGVATLFAEEEMGGLTADPLVSGMQVVAVLRQRQDPLAAAHVRKRLNNLYLALSSDGYWPHARYEAFPDGWWSAMDFASVGLASLMAYQVTHEQHYKDRAIQLIDKMIDPPSAKGALWRLTDGTCWFAEYAWTGQTVDKETFVLNGHLFALQALKYFAVNFPDRYRTAYDCATEGLRARRDSFDYPDKSWAYYMLEPLTENQSHYIIFETVQLDAMYALTGDELFKDLATRRRALLKRAFPVYRVNDRLFFSRIGPPHPYRLDIYATKIETLDEGGGVLSTHQLPLGESDSLDKLFINEPLPKAAKKARVISYSGEDNLVLFETEIKRIEPSSSKIAAADINSYFDTQPADNGEIIVEPAIETYPNESGNYLNHQGRIELSPSPMLFRRDIYIFGVEITVQQPESLQLLLMGINGQQAQRYLPAVRSGSVQTVLMAFEGIKNVSDLEGGFRKFTLVVDTPDGPRRSLTVHGLRIFKNSYELYLFAKEFGVDRLALTD